MSNGNDHKATAENDGACAPCWDEAHEWVDREGGTQALRYEALHGRHRIEGARKFRTIVADPPWAYPGPGGHLKSSPKHRPNSSAQNVGATSEGRYGAMSMDALRAMDVASIAEDDAHLYLWTTNKFVPEAFGLCEAWGFRPITLLTWGKVKPDGTPSMKIGHYYRGATEHVVFGVRGSLGLSGARAYPTLMLWPRTSGHSVKPDQFFDLVEEASPGPYAELFARRPRPGWSSWGNQVASDIEIQGAVNA